MNSEFKCIGIAMLLIGATTAGSDTKGADSRPNVLFIVMDDLNDWIEPLGGHPQARTPNLKRLATRSVTFTRNYCPSPGCNPSRSAVMTGYHTYTSGMYSNYQDWRKFALWDNLARCVLMIKVPKGNKVLADGARAGSRCRRVTSLIDIYPTLVELCGLPARSDLDGNSLVTLLADPDRAWNHPAITTYDFSEFSVRTERWRYIRYIDDSEELYDHDADPQEWHNLANDPRYRETKRHLASQIPQDAAPLREETLIDLKPHHFPPYRSREDYRRRQADKNKQKGQK